MTGIGTRWGATALLLAGLSACASPEFSSPPLGEAELSRINAPEARVALLTSVVRQDPENIDALKSLGREHRAADAWVESASAYREALILDPADRQALVGYSTALVAGRQYTSAFDHAQKALAQGQSMDALIAAGVSLDGLNRPGEAQTMYRAALANAPRDLDARNNLAISRAMVGDAGAYAMMEAVALAPDSDIRHRANLILVAALLGRQADARAYGDRFGFTKKDVTAIIRRAAEARRGGAGVIGVAASRV